MGAANIDIEIEQGSKFDPVYTWKDEDGNPRDLSTWTAKMEIRESKSKTSDIIHSATSAGGDITLNSDGEVRPVISALDTDQFNFEWAWYDIEATPSSGAADTKRLAQGKVRLDKAVTD